MSEFKYVCVCVRSNFNAKKIRLKGPQEFWPDSNLKSIKLLRERKREGWKERERDMEE